MEKIPQSPTNSSIYLGSQYDIAQQLNMCHLLRGGRSCVGQDTARLEVRPMSDELGNDMLERDGEDD